MCPAQDYASARGKLVEQIRAQGISDLRVLEAMRAVERHLFVPKDLLSRAYVDTAMPIGEGQTISQPYVVAMMSESLALKGTERVLEIGTGSGYQAAILSRLAKEVFTIEIKQGLQEKATKLLASLGLDNVRTRLGDGYFGWEDEAPFDCIMITAAVSHIPPPLLRQLKVGGRMVLPVGDPFAYQSLVLVTKTATSATLRHISYVTFVPMTGAALEEAR